MYCKRCNEYYYNKDHDLCSCELYRISCPDYYGDELQEIWAKSFDGAVEKFAKRYNEEESDCFIENDNLFDEPIKIIDNKDIKKIYNVYAEPTILYRAKEIKD